MTDRSPMLSRRAIYAFFIAALSLTAALYGPAVLSQNALRIDITGVGARQIPVAIAPFESATADTAFNQTVTQVIRSNLSRSGRFTIVDAGFPQPALSDRTDPANLYDQWRAKGAEALAIGSGLSLPGNRIEVRTILLDTMRSETLGGLSVNSERTELEARRTGHRISDYIYEKLLGEPGFFATRLAFIRKDGQQYSLVISDADGQNTQVALRSPQPLISIAWSPDGQRLAYVSFETGKPVIFIHDLLSGRRIAVANERGSNSAPAWSPDGKRLAVTLTRDGSSQIYLVNADGTGLSRLTRVNAINTEAAFSPDGQTIYFTSDRGGSAQIYRIPVAGGTAQRVTFNGPFNARPQVSSDHAHLVYVTRRDGAFRVASLNLQTQQEIVISSGPKDDSPSFAPNGRWVIYSSRVQGRQILVATSVDGKIRTRLSSDSGDVRGPAWGRLP